MEIALPRAGVVLPHDALWTPPSATDLLHDSVRELDRTYKRVKRWWLARERAGVLAIGTPTSLGSNWVFDAGNTFFDLTVGASVAIGQFVVAAWVGANSAGMTSGTFSDSKGNTWSTDVSNFASGTSVAIGSAQITSALTTSDTIRLTTAAFGESGRMMAAMQVSGIVTSSAKDKSSSGTGTAVGWSSGATAALAQANELCVAVCGNDSTANEDSTPGSGWNELVADFHTSTALNMSIVWKIVAATTAVTGDGTWTNSGSRAWAAAVATYKGTTTEFARPDADVTDGSWLNEAGSNTNLFQSIDETVADDVDYIESSKTPSSDLAEIGLSNITP